MEIENMYVYRRFRDYEIVFKHILKLLERIYFYAHNYQMYFNNVIKKECKTRNFYSN